MHNTFDDDDLPDLEGYVRQTEVNKIIKARLERDRKQQAIRHENGLLEEIRDELRSLRVMVAAVKDTQDNE